MARVRDVMTSELTTCSPQATAVEAARLMAKEDVGPIPVVDNGRLVGIVTDRDLVIRVLAEGKDPQSATVGEIASQDLVKISPDDELDRALQLMAENQVRRLPVVEGDRLVGIVAQRDVALEGRDRETGQVVEEISR